MNDWIEWSRYVLEALKDAKTERAEIKKKLNNLEVSLTRLETKVAVRAGITGAIAGGVFSGIIVLLVALLSR